MEESTQLIDDPDKFKTFQEAMDLYTEQKFDQSVVKLEELKKEMPNEVAVIYFIGENCMSMKQFDKAFDMFKKVYCLLEGREYHRCISNICMLISKSVVVRGYPVLLDMYKAGKSVRIVFLLLEQLNRKILYNPALYCVFYAPVIKKLLAESDHTFLSLYSRIVYDHSLFRALLQGKEIDEEYGWKQYYNKLELLTDIPINYVDTNFVKLFAEIVFLQGNLNHTALSYLRDDNYALYKRVALAYRKLFPILTESRVDMSEKREKVHLNLFIVCKKLLYEGPLLYRWYNHIVALAADKRFNVYLVADKTMSSPYASMLLTKVKDVVDSYDMSLFRLIDAIASGKPDLILYLDPGKSIADYMLAQVRLAPIQCSTFEFPERLGIEEIDYYISSNRLGSVEGGDEEGEESGKRDEGGEKSGKRDEGGEKVLRLDCYPYSFVNRCADFREKVDEVGVQSKLCIACIELFDLQFFDMLERIKFKWNFVIVENGCPEYDRACEQLLKKKRLNVEGAIYPPTLYYYCKCLSSCRVGLDPYPNSNLGMCIDMLSLGKPVVTLMKEGCKMRESYVGAVLKEIGLEELVAGSEEEYGLIVDRLLSDDTWYQEIVEKVVEAKKLLFREDNRLVEQLSTGLMGLVKDKIVLLDKQKHFFKVLKLIKKILGSAGVEFFLTSGTLLGYQREHNILEHDKDIDIGVFEKEFIKAGGLKGIIKLFTEEGFKVALILGTEKEGLQASFSKEGVGLDVFVYYDYNEEYYNMDCYYRYIKRLKYLYKKFGLKECTFLGEKFMIPDDPIRHLLDDYGEGWCIPDPKYCWFTQPNAVYPYGYCYVRADDVDEVVEIALKRVYKKIVLFVEEESLGGEGGEREDLLLRINEMLGEMGDVIVVSRNNFMKEMTWRVYDHPREFSCFISKFINGSALNLVRYDMACLDISSGGYGVVPVKKGEDDGWGGRDEEWIGMEIDWSEFAKLEINELLTVPHQYEMYGDLFFKIVANKMTEMFKLNKESKVLEIACGVGAVAQHLECDYVGVDNCQEVINRHLEISSSHKVVCRDATDVGFKEEEFDLVFIWNSLGFFKDISYIERVLKEVERVGKRYLFLGDVDINVWPKDYFLFNGWSEVELVGGSKRFLHFVKVL